MLDHIYFYSQLEEQHDRRRIFLELHDGLIQKLVDAHMRLDPLLTKEGLSSDKVAELRQLINSAITDARRVSNDICPHVLYENGLKAALSEFIEEYRRTYGISCSFRSKALYRKTINEPLRIVVYQLIRQLLIGLAEEPDTNVVNLWVQKHDEGLELQIESDGLDFDLQDILYLEHSKKNLFFTGVCQKVRFLGGDIHIEYGPDLKTVNIGLPLNCPSFDSRTMFGISRA
jgi:signal transduction histidine kinase